jgi:hypothetical protein
MKWIGFHCDVWIRAIPQLQWVIGSYAEPESRFEGISGAAPVSAVGSCDILSQLNFLQ